MPVSACLQDCPFLSLQGKGGVGGELLGNCFAFGEDHAAVVHDADTRVLPVNVQTIMQQGCVPPSDSKFTLRALVSGLSPFHVITSFGLGLLGSDVCQRPAHEAPKAFF